jgi:hypothetical protein
MQNMQARSKLGSGGELLQKKGDVSPEERAKEIEAKVHELLEASALAAARGDVSAGVVGI